jgi:hypothetical protein
MLSHAVYFANKGPAPLFILKGKTCTLFLNAIAQAILLRHVKEDPDARIFPYRQYNFGTAEILAFDRAGIAPLVPHGIRHSTAHILVDRV